jgi:hypothetical protein
VARSPRGFERILGEITEAFDCGIDIFEVPGLLGAMKEGEGEFPVCLNGAWIRTCKGTRSFLDEW